MSRLVRTNSEGSTVAASATTAKTTSNKMTTTSQKQLSTQNSSSDSTHYQTYNQAHKQNKPVNNNLDAIYGPENLFFNNSDLVNSSKVFKFVYYSFYK